MGIYTEQQELNLLDELEYIKQQFRTVINEKMKDEFLTPEDKFETYIDVIAEYWGDIEQYKQWMDDIYLALIDRGLMVDKDDPGSFAAAIGQLRKIDLFLTIEDTIAQMINVATTDIVTTNINKLVDNTKLKLYNQKKAILSDEIHSTISVKTIKGVSLTGLGINDNLSTVMK